MTMGTTGVAKRWGLELRERLRRPITRLRPRLGWPSSAPVVDRTAAKACAVRRLACSVTQRNLAGQHASPSATPAPTLLTLIIRIGSAKSSAPAPQALRPGGAPPHHGLRRSAPPGGRIAAAVNVARRQGISAMSRKRD